MREPIFLRYDNGTEINARFVMGNERAESLVHGKIYTLDELKPLTWLITQKGEKPPKKVQCIRGL